MSQKQLTAAEVQAHPEFPHIYWKLEPTKSGKLPVAKYRGGPLNIYYQVHGHGPTKLVFVMGLGGLHTLWQRQTKDFGHTQADKYSVLVLDNRGIGKSDRPLTRYSTSEMAKDVIEIIDHLGWTNEREINLVGISMGGMIAQEMALLLRTRLSSLLLLSTAARLVNTVGFLENLRNRITLFLPKSLDTQIQSAKAFLYSSSFLTQPDDLASECIVQPFPTAGDRFAAGEITKKLNKEEFTRAGFVCQAVAAGWHHKTREELRVLVEGMGRGGRRRIAVVHGTEDRMITVPHGRTLIEELDDGGKGGEWGSGGDVVRGWIVEGQGHVIPIERREEMRRFIEEMVEEGRRLNEEEKRGE